MENSAETSTPGFSAREAFQTTHWSVVLSSGHDSVSVARQAVERLCQSYWFPLYAYVRRHGYSREDAQDLTQSFFERFLEHGYFARAEPERGRFRTFLLTSLKRFLTEEWRRANRQKRGGNQTFVPFDAVVAEDRYSAEPRDELSPDLLYDLRWAGVLLDRVVTRLRKDYESTGRTEVYTQLQGFLWGRQAEISYAEMSERLGMNAGAVKVAVHRLRQRFRDLLREEVANTVSTQEQIEEELRHLLRAFGG